MSTPTSLQLAYLAGIFDGEGSIGIYKKQGKYFTARASVTMCDPIVPAMFQTWFGGSLTHYDATELHCGKEQWSVSEGNGGHLEVFLRAILPYLQTKESQVWFALHYLENRKNLVTEQLTLTPELRRQEFEFRQSCSNIIAAMKQIPKEDVIALRLYGGQ